MSKTLQERFIEALSARGERELKRTFKYIVFSRKDDTSGYHYYLGRAGSLRVGPTVQASVPCSQAFRRSLLGPTLEDLGL